MFYYPELNPVVDTAKLLLYTKLAQKEDGFALPACSREKIVKYSMAGTEQENQDCLAKSARN